MSILNRLIKTLTRRTDSAPETSLQAVDRVTEARRHFDIGHDFYSAGKLEDALASVNRAIALDPSFPDALFARGVILKDLGRWAEALESFDASIALNPGFAPAHHGRGAVLRCQDRLEEALSACDRTITLAPDFLDAHVGRAAVLKDLGRFREALESCDRAIALSPNHADAHNNRGTLLREFRRWDEALKSFDTALALNPNHADAHTNRGLVLQELGRLDEALSSFARAIALRPNAALPYDNMLYTMCFQAKPDPGAALETARRYGIMVESQANAYEAWQNSNGGDRLTVGLVSGDFFGHSVGFFLESVVSSIDPKKIRLVAYPTRTREDELTARIKPRFAAWCPIAGLSDEASARRIHSDGVDILVDLAGHTAFNRLPVFAWKPAPVQASWLGYCATTGLPSIDYYIADRYTVPEGDEAQFLETIWRLKESYLCMSRPEAVEVARLPALASGHITFGSFNNRAKMTAAVIAVWARILNRVAGSRLFLKAEQYRDDGNRENVLAEFAAHGVGNDRLLLASPISERKDHLAAYNQVDIGLDPFPYNGVTTTFEALWMGVPVISLAGRSFLSRQGMGILSNANLSEWIATNEDDYVERAVAHARDLDRLAALRAALRRQLEGSPLFDAERFARSLEEAFFGMWRERGERRTT